MSNEKTTGTTAKSPSTPAQSETPKGSPKVGGTPLTPPPAPAPKGRKPVDPNESPDRKFRRLATKRMSKALKTIGYVANLGNKRQYQYTDEQREKIIKALTDAVLYVRQKFSDEENKAESFTL